MEQWKRQQEKEIDKLFDCYNKYVCIFDELPPLAPWMRWTRDYICRSFENLDRKWTWVEALMMQEDDSVFMTRHGERAFAYLRQIRNYARGPYQREDHGINPPFYKA